MTLGRADWPAYSIWLIYILRFYSIFQGPQATPPLFLQVPLRKFINTIKSKYKLIYNTGATIYRVSACWNCYYFFKIHQECQNWGCHEKFRIFATRWALRFSKLKKKWLRKWSLNLATHPSLLTISIHWSFLQFSAAFGF